MKQLVLGILLYLPNLAVSQNWEDVIGGTNNEIRCIYVDTIADKLYLTGKFDTVAGIQAHRMVEWDGVSWNSMCTPSSPFISTPVVSITRFNNNIYASSSALGIDNNPALGHSIKYDAGTWVPFGDFNMTGYIRSDDENLFYIGYDMEENGIPMGCVARWNGSSWEAFGDPSIWTGSGDFLEAIVKFNGNYVVGGNFDYSNGREEIMQWDGNTWTSLENGILGGMASVRDMIVYQGILYVGGSFTEGEGNISSYLMAWDGEKWHKPFPDVNFQNDVYDFQIVNNELYILGNHNYVGETNYRAIAKFDGTNFCSFGGNSTPLESGVANDFGIYNGDIFVGGTNVYFEDTIHYFGKYIGAGMDTCILSPVHLGLDGLYVVPNQFSIYPIPASNVLHVDQKGNNELISITIQSITGQIVYKSTSDSESNKIDVSLFQHGCYFIRIEDENGFVMTDKWIKE